MRLPDKILVAVVVGLLGIAALAFFTVANQPKATYREGTTATDVAYNYLFALQHGDYERAYAYLSPQVPEYPKNLKQFVSQIHSDSYRFPLDEGVTLDVLSADSGDAWATAKIRDSRFYNNGPFNSERSSSTFNLQLELVDGSWKISGGELFFPSAGQREDVHNLEQL